VFVAGLVLIALFPAPEFSAAGTAAVGSTMTVLVDVARIAERRFD
jgi:hypothetical protein